MAKRRRKWLLREWREHRKLSQERLGALVGVTQGMISHLETGESDYTGDLLDKIVSALNITIFDLFYRHPKINDDPRALFAELPAEERSRAIELLKAFNRTAPR